MRNAAATATATPTQFGFEWKLIFTFVPTVCLQPFDFDPNEKNRHKFMVQSVVAPDGEFNAEQLVREQRLKLRGSARFQVYLFLLTVERSETRGAYGLEITMRFRIPR